MCKLGRLDRMAIYMKTHNLLVAFNPNPKTDGILKELIDKAIPMIDYYGEYRIAEALYGDAIDEGLSAAEIRVEITKIFELDEYFQDYKCLSMLGRVNLLAAVQIAAERYADAVEAICFNKEEQS